MASRIGQSPISIPESVQVTIKDQLVSAKSKSGELSLSLHPLVGCELAEGVLTFSMIQESSESNALMGTMRSLVSNMVFGLSEGFTVKLKMIGVGYRAAVQGSKLTINAGFSHPVVITVPEGIKVECPSNTEINVLGADKQKVGQLAANIRSVRPPEPYKGKGIRYVDEVVIKKEGKKK